MAGVVLCLLLAVAGAYVGCYLGMSDLSPALTAAPLNGKPGLVRFYDAWWKATIFSPAAKIESALRGCQVDVVGPLHHYTYD